MQIELDMLLDRVVERLLSCSQENILTIALGGSQSTNKNDTLADVDLVVILGETALQPASQNIREIADNVLLQEDCLSSGPTWKEGFGSRTTYLLTNGMKFEIFVNTPSTLPNQRRILSWKALVGAEHLLKLKNQVEKTLTNENSEKRAINGHYYCFMSICRHLARNEVVAAQHVMGAYRANILALALSVNGNDFDPYTSYKRIFRDGYHLSLAMINRILNAFASLETANDLHYTLIEVDAIFDNLMKEEIRSDYIRKQLETGVAVKKACLSWLS